jgi:hypothetical protein
VPIPLEGHAGVPPVSEADEVDAIERLDDVLQFVGKKFH